MNITMMTEEQTYLVICIVSIVACLMDSILLLDMHRFNKEISDRLYKPVRYISARIALGLAFLIIALMTAGLLFKGTGGGQPPQKFFSIGNLVISSSLQLQTSQKESSGSAFRSDNAVRADLLHIHRTSGGRECGVLLLFHFLRCSISSLHNSILL